MNGMNGVDFLVTNGIDVNHGLELLGDMETYNSIMNDFLEAYSGRMKKIENYKNTSDMTNYAIEVHSLKSDSKYLGFMTLADLAYNHEMASKAGDITTVNNSYDALLSEANRVIAVVKKYLNKEDNSDTVVSFDEVNKALLEATPIPRVVPTPIEETVNIPVTGVVTGEEVNNSNLNPTVAVNKSILVADDSSIIRNFVKEIFSKDYDVLTASNGDEVITLVNDKTKDIVAVLLDLNMPGKNGFDVLEYFKENNLFGKIPVSIISGASDKESIDKAFKYPIIDMLNKPFGRDNVKSVVRKTIDYNEVI